MNDEKKLDAAATEETLPVEKTVADGAEATAQPVAPMEMSAPEAETVPVQEQAEEPPVVPFAVDMSAAEGTIPDYVRTSQPVYDFETADGKQRRRRRPRKRGVGVLGGTIYLIVVLLVAVVLALFALSVVKDITGISKDDKEIIVTIPEGATLTDIAVILEENGLIDSRVGLLAFAKLTNRTYSYQPGECTLNAKWGYNEMLKALAQQKVVRETVNVTIVEGKTVEQIAELLEASKVCTAVDFLKVIEEGDFSDDYDFIAALPENQDRIHRLEGYIFPNTYNFYINSDPEEAVRKFLDSFDDQFDQELRQLAADQGMTVDDVVKLASIVQKEGASQKTMKMVARVFLNRMENKNYQYLQSNATLSYSKNEAILWITEEQMNEDDPYNSYKYKGLPPSAICNPGLQAIKAVLEPDDNDYYYFVTDSESKFYFSKTANEHEKQAAAIRKNGTGIGEGIS